jgi:hypothetical protein
MASNVIALAQQLGLLQNVELQLNEAQYENCKWYFSFFRLRANSSVGDSCGRGKKDAR